MIRIKSMRLKGVNSANLAGPGSTSVSCKDADMFFFPVEEYVAARRKNAAQDEFIIPTADIAFMVPMEPLGCFKQLDTADESDRLDEEETVVAAVAEIAETRDLSEKTQGEDVVRMVKIGGAIVERKGPPKDDELEALTAPKRGIFEKKK